MKDLMDMKSLPKFGATKKTVRKTVRKVKGRWDDATEKSIKRHRTKVANTPSRDEWVVYGNKEYYAEQDRRANQSARDKRSNDYRHSGHGNSGVGW